MLKTRIVTAVLVLPVVLVALFLFPAWAWVLFSLGIVLVSFWEWSRFCGWATHIGTGYLALSSAGAIALAALAIFSPLLYDVTLIPVLCIAAAFWCVAVPLWLKQHWRPSSPIWIGLAGWFVILPFETALISLRAMGAETLLFFAAVVWVADIAAYFAGKAFGKHKLAPAISPGKTWEGVAGALIGVSLLWGGLFTGISTRFQWPVAIDMRDAFVPGLAVFLALAAVSIFGDLFESWMKRGAGLKDSSGLLPGHGGVLDRIDALTACLPIACALMLVLR
jgi:phosphatidate cytidylyltransferase